MNETTELQIRFDKLQKKREDANNNVISLQTKIDSAKEAIKQITDGWKGTYGFETYEDAQKKLEELSAEINTTMSACESYLEQVGM